MYRFEAITCAKDPSRPERNEDRMVLVPGHGFAVIDGATDISGLRHDDRLGRQATGGRLAAAAIAEAFASAWACEPEALPEPADLAAMATRAIASVYRRLGIADQVASSPERRFRASFVAAVGSTDAILLIRVGDCGIRVDGKPVLPTLFPGDVVLSALRAHTFSALAGHGVSAGEVRQLSRQLIVEGTSASEALAALGPGEADAVLRATRGDTGALAAVEGDRQLLDEILEAGLSGIRRAPERYGALCTDGVSELSGTVASARYRLSEISTIELFSDGYPAQPTACEIGAWEAALAEADAVDPERIHAFRSTKGRVGGSFGDDRSLIIIRNGD